MIKVSIIGAGTVGSTVAHLLAQKGFYDLHLIDKPGSTKAKGKAVDIMQALAIQGTSLSYSIKGSDVIQDIKRSDVVIVAAGVNKTPDMTRQDLALQNGRVIDAIAHNVKQYAPDSFVIVVTNPLDSMTWHFQKSAEFPEHKVVGMGGVLDTGRFKYFLSRRLNLDVRDIHTLVIGSHDEHMIPLLSYTTISGIPIMDYIQQHDIKVEIINEAMQATKKSSQNTYFGPAEGIVKMVEAYVFDQKRIMSCSVNLNMAEPENDVYIGLPTVIGGQGVELICPVSLSTEEESDFRQNIQNMITFNIALSLATTKMAASA